MKITVLTAKQISQVHALMMLYIVTELGINEEGEVIIEYKDYNNRVETRTLTRFFDGLPVSAQ